MLFTSQNLLVAIKQLPSARRYWVAYSGGLDSHVLLHSLAAVRNCLPAEKLCAVHINHGLSLKAGEWAEHCLAICKKLDISCRTLIVDARPGKGESPEASARTARYSAITSLLEEGDGLLTAHHQSDQAETVLLQMLRGSGSRGLAAMPCWDSFGSGWRGRPLLGFSRSELLSYAQTERLDWVDDESNFDTGIERNFLRHEIIPLLRSHWPALDVTLSRVASHSAEAALLLDQMAVQDLIVETDGSLSISYLKTLEISRQRNLLRYWIKKSGLPLPDTVHLQRIINEVLPAAIDGMPCVSWMGAEIRRYRDRLCVMAPLSPHNNSRIHVWDMTMTLFMDEGGGTLKTIPVVGRGIKQSLCQISKITVGFRQGGERCRLTGRSHTHRLKKLLQEYGIPPWQRERIPLIYLDGNLAAVSGLFVCHPFQAQHNEPGLDVKWN